MNKKGFKVCKLMTVCDIIYNLQCLVYNNNKQYILFDSIFLDEYVNLWIDNNGKYEYEYIWFEDKKGEYKYEYIWVDKKRRIQLQI